MRASNKNGAEALLAVPFAFPTKLVIFLSAACIKKECPFSLKIFRHTGYRGHLPSFYIFSRSTKTSQASFYCMVSGRFWTFPLDRIGFSMTVASSSHPLFQTRYCRAWVSKKHRIAAMHFPNIRENGNFTVYIRTVASIILVSRYVCTRRFAAKAVYVRPSNSFNPHEAPYPPSGWIGNIVAVFQIVSLCVGNNRIAEAAGFQRHQ